jgi:ribose transport system permease protein
MSKVRSWKLPINAQQYSVAVILLMVCLLFSILSKDFLSLTNLTNILLQCSSTAIAAIGMTFVLILGEVDISIGALVALAMTVGWAVAVVPTVPGEEAPVSFWIYPVGLLMGALLGAINATLISSLRISALIATLATMFVFRGVAWKMVGSGDKPFSESAVDVVGRTTIFGLGLPVYLMVLVAFIASLILHRMVIGRYLLAIGGSPRSAIETGLPIKRVRLFAYSFLGVCCALSGFITIGRVGVLQANLGVGFEFTVIVAVVLGGTSLLGGRGSILGTILGSILLVVIENGLNLMNASVYIYDVVKGIILIVGVMMDVTLLARIRANSQARLELH